MIAYVNWQNAQRYMHSYMQNDERKKFWKFFGASPRTPEATELRPADNKKHKNKQRKEKKITNAQHIKNYFLCVVHKQPCKKDDHKKDKKTPNWKTSGGFKRRRNRNGVTRQA